jgi:hypothetical protein
VEGAKLEALQRGCGLHGCLRPCQGTSRVFPDKQPTFPSLERGQLGSERQKHAGLATLNLQCAALLWCSLIDLLHL